MSLRKWIKRVLFLVNNFFKYKNKPSKSNKQTLALKVTIEAFLFLPYGMPLKLEFVFTWREKKAKVMWPPLTAERYMTAGRGIYHMTFTSRASFDLSDDLNNTSETHIKCWAGHSDHSIQHDVIGWLSRGIQESRLWLQRHSTTVDPLGLVVLSRCSLLYVNFYVKRLGINLHGK